jgi:hypothetical protein
MKFLVLNLPWPRGTSTLAKLVAKQQYDFAHEHQRCLQLIDKFTGKRLTTSGPRIPFLEKSQAGTSAGFKPNIWITISGNLGCEESDAEARCHESRL